MIPMSFCHSDQFQFRRVIERIMIKFAALILRQGVPINDKLNLFMPWRHLSLLHRGRLQKVTPQH